MARILVVDDVRFISEMIAGLFRALGHEVFTADDGTMALEIAGRERLDLVLLDIAMPRMDGVEVARQLRAAPATRTVPILMVTSQSDHNSIARATEAGANDHIVKPFQNEILMTKCAELLGGFRMSVSVETERGVPVMTVLRAEIGGEAAGDLEAALEEAGASGAVVMLDLSRVTKIDQSCADVLVRRADRMRAEGRPLRIVRPGRGVGTRTLVVRLEPHAELHARREDALRAAVAASPQEPPAPADAPEPVPAPAGSAAGGPSCLVESIGKVTMVRVRGGTLEEAVGEVRAQVLPLARQDVLLTLKRVTELTPGGLTALSSLAGELRGSGRALRIAHAEPDLADALRTTGRDDLLAGGSPAR